MKKTNKNIEWLLRMGVFMTFLGHGIFAINSQPHWIIYLETVGFSQDLAQDLIVYIGYLDLVIASFILIRPNRIVVIWAIFWAFSTALIRLISGESIWQFVERGANWIAPLCLYYVIYFKANKKDGFRY